MIEDAFNEPVKNSEPLQLVGFPPCPKYLLNASLLVDDIHEPIVIGTGDPSGIVCLVKWDRITKDWTFLRQATDHDIKECDRRFAAQCGILLEEHK